MKKILIAAAAVTLMCGTAFAAEGDNFNGAASKTDTMGQSAAGMHAGSLHRRSTRMGVTTGMASGKTHNSMKKDDVQTDTSKSMTK
jgi:hypothetical protein